MVDERDALKDHLAKHGVGSAIHYPHALHEQPAFTALEPLAGACPVATRAAQEVLCLPVFPELTDGEVDRVADAVEGFASRTRGALS